jgi:hypothetical protein
MDYAPEVSQLHHQYQNQPENQHENLHGQVQGQIGGTFGLHNEQPTGQTQAPTEGIRGNRYLWL